MGLWNKKMSFKIIYLKLQLIFLQRINILYFINLPPSYLKNNNMQIILFISKLLKKENI